MPCRDSLIRHLKRQRVFDIDDVVSWSNRLLPHFVPPQNRYKVSDRITVRIVRYYLNLGLISKPDGFRGRHAVFGAVQVIQILVVKALQAQYVPLKRIAGIMASAGEPELTAWLLRDKSDSPAALPLSTGVESMTDPVAGVNATVAADSSGRPSRAWRRIPIHEEIELALAPAFNLYDHYSERGEILTKIMRAMTGAGSHGARSAAGEKEPVPAGPAKALINANRAVIALVTEGGLVPKGNPDRMPSARSKSYLRYSLEGLNDLEAGQFESVDRGWDNSHVNDDPDRLLPLDVMRELESRHHFSRLHPFFFSTTGVGTTIENARQIGRGIAREIKAQGVSAVLLTAT